MGSWFWEIQKAGSNNIVGLGADEQFAYTFDEEGTYFVRMYATNCLGCSSVPTEVTVNVADADAIEIICPSVVCQSPNPVEYCSETVCSSYAWQVTGGTIQGPVDQQCVNIVWDMPPQGGYGYVTLNTAGCPTNTCVLPVTVEVPVIPTALNIDGPAQLCDPNGIGVNYSVPFWPGATYQWSAPVALPGSVGSVNPLSAPTNNDFHIRLVNFTGFFRLNVVVTHPVTNCTASGEIIVEVRDYRLTSASVCFGSDVTLEVLPGISPAPYTVNWTVRQTDWSQQVQNQSNVTLPFAAFNGAGTFNVAAEIMFNGVPMFT